MINNSENIDVIHKFLPISYSSSSSSVIAEADTDSPAANYYKDTLSISDEYYEKFKSENSGKDKANTAEAELKSGEKSIKSPSGKELKEEDKKLIKELEKRDQEVRTHEEAHKAAGAGLVKDGASYNYTTGPDGKQYAIGGEVKIDMSPVPDDPEATIRKMQQVKRAALAPSDPSSTDLSAAHAASKMEAEAKKELESSKLDEKGKN